RVLASAHLQITSTAATGFHGVFCRFGIAPAGSPNPTLFGQEVKQDIPPNTTAPVIGQVPMVAGTTKPAGDYIVNVGCRSDSPPGTDIKFDSGDLVVWALPAQ
ncbi:MAG: hypothetical protein H0V25_12090, partial [Solirubrobacterales bacterium]|nr:hypothetical protein [Solirubrobacterales bacterium]